MLWSLNLRGNGEALRSGPRMDLVATLMLCQQATPGFWLYKSLIRQFGEPELLLVSKVRQDPWIVKRCRSPLGAVPRTEILSQVKVAAAAR